MCKKALSYGGDGNLYFLTPDLTEAGIRAKCGDCTLVVFPNGKTMMIDAGYIACSAHIISLLEDLGLHHLDYLYCLMRMMIMQEDCSRLRNIYTVRMVVTSAVIIVPHL